MGSSKMVLVVAWLASAAALPVAAAPARPAVEKPTARPAPEKGVDPALADRTAEAKVRFKRASEYYRQGRYKEAIVEFQKAYALRPHGVIFFNLAQCHEKLGDIPEAMRAYHEYLRRVPEAEDRETVLSIISNLEARLAARGVQQLEVDTDPPGADIYIDNKFRGPSPLVIQLPPGQHLVSAARTGSRVATRVVTLTAGRSLQLDFGQLAAAPAALPPAPPPAPSLALGPGTTGAPTVAAAAGSTAPLGTPAAEATHGADALAPRPPPPGLPGAPVPPAPPARRSGRLWTWVAAGVAGAGLVAGVASGLSARSAEDKLHGSVHDSATASKLRDDARRSATRANLCYGLAGVAGAAGATLFFLEGSF